ncbi:hypothetical protein BSKO_11578 [Bryopsis sp. KO-2023]|nr:hypothetical protein BSKO_11578 [Bryopsis sp. KO-2023]
MIALGAVCRPRIHLSRRDSSLKASVHTNESASRDSSRRIDLIRSKLCLPLGLAVACTLVGAQHADCAEVIIQGTPKVVDGDTLQINDDRIRLFGVDAPELRQECSRGGKPYACGEISRDALRNKIGNSKVKCVEKNKDIYGRSVSICFIDGTNFDLNKWMVDNGQAVAYRKYSKSYDQDEVDAQKGKKGIWSGEFEEPETWRRENGRGKASQSVRSIPAEENKVVCASGAPIKGNISSSGEKIYHIPGGRYYEQVKIDSSSGERFFCSENDAVKAGWRKSKS